MSDRALFWLGTVMLAMAVGLLIGGLILPRPAHGQQLQQVPHYGEGRSSKYIVVAGVEGSARRTQTVYITDCVNDILYIFEYNSAARDVRLRNLYDVRLFSTRLIKERDKRGAGLR